MPRLIEDLAMMGAPLAGQQRRQDEHAGIGRFLEGKRRQRMAPPAEAAHHMDNAPHGLEGCIEGGTAHDVIDAVESAPARQALYARSDAVITLTGGGAGLRLITMDTAFAEMPDALWLKRVLPTAQIAMRSNSRLLQAEFCRQGMGLAVLPKPLGDRIPDIVPIDLGGRHPSGTLTSGIIGTCAVCLACGHCSTSSSRGWRADGKRRRGWNRLAAPESFLNSADADRMSVEDQTEKNSMRA
jgi:hypothetical protein